MPKLELHLIASLSAIALMSAAMPVRAQDAEVDFLLRGSGDPVVVTTFSDDLSLSDQPDSGAGAEFIRGAGDDFRTTGPVEDNTLIIPPPLALPPDPAPNATPITEANAQPGPAMAGPTADQPIGPAMRGPEVAETINEEINARADGGEPEDNPFAAPGIALGTFIVRPTLDVGVVATSNVDGGPAGPEAVGALVDVNIEAISESETHLVRFEIRGAAALYGDDQYDEKGVDARFLARFELASQTTIETTAGYNLDQTSYTDPDTPDDATQRPDVHTLSAGGRISRTGGIVTASLAGSVARVINEDVTLAGGGSANLSERDSTEYAVETRLSVVPSPSFAPFVAVSAGRVDYDQRIDSNGIQRARSFSAARAGIALDRGPKLSGEFSLGYQRDDFDDPALASINSVVVAADLLWSPVRLTEVRIGATSLTDGSFQPGVSGSRNHAITASVSRQFRDRLRATAGGVYEREDFVGLMRTDNTITGYAELVYDMSRYAAIVGRYVFVDVDSDATSVSGTEHRLSMRLRMKR